jgi:hypothetical protein
MSSSNMQHNVDICVTCVSDKPPKLPLREELPSLGIEVVYNARGVGAKAAQNEADAEKEKKRKKALARKLLKEKKIKKRQQQKQTSSRLDPPSKEEEDIDEREDVPLDEDGDYIPKALSYSSYQRSLEQKQSEDGHADEFIGRPFSLGSNSNMESDQEERQGENQPVKSNQKKMKSASSAAAAAAVASDARLAKIDDPKHGQKNNKRTTTKKKSNDSPPKNIQFPITQDDVEEQAIEDAFRVFSGATTPKLNNKDENTPKKGKSKVGSSNNTDISSLGGTNTQNSKSSGSNPSTLTSTLNANGQQQQIHTVKIVTAGEARDDLPDLLVSSDDDSTTEEENDDIDTDSENTSSEKDSGKNGGNIRVKLFSHGSNITEMYDLTELSDDDATKHDDETLSKDLSTLSSRRGGLSSIHTNTTVGAGSNHHQNHHMNATLKERRRIEVDDIGEGKVEIPVLPQVDDGYGHLALDLSYVEEEDGPGSPLVYSPPAESVGDDDIYSPGDSPTTQRVHRNDYKKKQEQHSFHQHGMTTHRDDRDLPYLEDFNGEEDRQDDDILESPTSFVGNNEREMHSSPTGATNYNLVNKGSMFNEASFKAYSVQPPTSPSERSASRLGIASAYHPQPSSLSPANRMQRVRSFDQDESSNDLSLPNMNFSNVLQIAQNTDRTNALAPALRKNPSRESVSFHKSPKVSFSQDVEERFFDNTVGGGNFKSFMTPSKLPQQTIVREDKDLAHHVSSARSREADEAFQTLAEKLGMDDDEFRSPEVMLVEALSFGEPIPFDFEETIKRNPDLAAGRLPETDSFALHAACTRSFPDRFRLDQRCRVTDLVDDILLHQKLVNALVHAYPEACRQVDGKGDLPVHIMARQLMEWEAKWYQKVYEKAKAEEYEEENGRGITRLYQTMSECINTLLWPISNRSDLCLQGGSIGRLLPLHIAAIFTVSYDTLKSVLSARPESASIKCELGTIRTFIPDHCTPLELHDRLSTDFPKWEIRRANSDPSSKEISQDNLDQIYGTKDAMRRSDLMFAYSPTSMPYRTEKDRIKRLESRMRSEMLNQEAASDFQFEKWISIFWLFICQFENKSDEGDHYSDSVERITESLSATSIIFLARVELRDEKCVIDQATVKCRDIMLDRLKHAAQTEIPVPLGSLRVGTTSTGNSIFLRQFEEDMAHRYCLRGRGFIGPLCRSLFNVTEGTFPTSFVVLPYKLVKDSEGRLGLDSAKAAAVAMKFADSLLQLTSPQSIIQSLDRKSSRFVGRGLVADDNDEWWQAQHRLKTEIRDFLSLYENGPGYFYFLDEYTGTPIVNESSFYPLVIREAADIVRKILPLMLSGMILMRGEKAINIVATTLLDENVQVIHPHWIEAAKDMVGYLFSPQTEWTASFVRELLPLREQLVAMIEDGPTTPVELEKNGNLLTKTGLTSEWVVETSLVKMMVEMHDPRHTFGGLRPRRSGNQVLWTKERAFLHPDSPEYMMQVDFKSLEQLKEMNFKQMKVLKDEKEQTLMEAKEFVTHDKQSKYDDLFEDLAIPIPDTDLSENKSETSDDGSDTDSSRDEDLPKIIEAPYPVQQRHMPHSSSLVQSTSILDFDDDLDLDDVLKIRIQLDEQESKMEYLREKIEDLSAAEDRLLRQEEKMQQMIDEILHQKYVVVADQQQRQHGLSKARSLLLRICDLEERVLCREVELGQLSNDISLFELEASTRLEKTAWKEEEERHLMSSSSDSSKAKHKQQSQPHQNSSSDDSEHDDNDDTAPHHLNFSSDSDNDDVDEEADDTTINSASSGDQSGTPSF